MYPRLLVRTEGLVFALLAIAVFSILDGPWWLFLVLFLAPDIAMLGYLAGVRTGSMAYNAAHTYLGPVALGAVGLWMGIEIAVLGALIWSAHIGFDRVVGYGLKYPTTFKDNHLRRLSRPKTDQIQDPASVTPAD